jgi:aspartyl-tRNA(Asn)/glutamyl-tRNA(Gln) amidotransferase subunit A
LCYAALGTDTGGSIRIPVAFHGIVGMKPTFGRVSKYGVFPLSWTLDHVGPMTRNVKDNAILLSILAGHDKRDSYSRNKNTEDFTRSLDKSI